MTFPSYINVNIPSSEFLIFIPTNASFLDKATPSAYIVVVGGYFRSVFSEYYNGFKIRAFAAVIGTIIVVTILWDGFETFIFPRRVTRKVRLTRLFYRYTWLAWSKIVTSAASKKSYETYLSFYGPLSLRYELHLFLSSITYCLVSFLFL